MQYPQTRYTDTLLAGITSGALAMTVASVAPTRTEGILTLGRSQSNTEDVYYNGVAGTVVTINLRGLSQTALTPTTVLANQKVHNANESVEMTTHHNYDTDLLRKSEADTVTGAITFSGTNTFSGNNNAFTGTGNRFSNAIRIPGLLDANGNETIDTAATASAINQLSVQNAAIGNNVIVTTAGDDTNINLELQAKGSGVVIVEDAAQLKTSAAPTTDAQIANKKYVDDQLARASSLYELVTYGDTITAGQLLYQNSTTMKWVRTSTSSSTWYEKLAIAVDSGVDTDTNKTVLLKGKVSGLTFNNINPTFSSALTGTDNAVGDNVARALRAFLVTNTSGAECIVTGGTISAKQTGTPAGAMQIYLVLEQQEQANTPAAFRDVTSNVGTGAIIASATIAQALFSGTYASLPFSFGGNIKIPATCNAYLVIGKTGAADAANYYNVQSNAATLTLNSTTETWSGTVNAGNLTLTVTSTSPVGYAVKITGTGSYSLTPSNPWSRVIGKVISSTEMYFDPERKRSKIDFAQMVFSDTGGGFFTVTNNFCPSEVKVVASCQNRATAPLYSLYHGNIRGDTSFATSFIPSNPRCDVSNTDSINFLAGEGSNPAGTTTTQVTEGKMIVSPNSAGLQNELYIVRLETGYYVYNGYPAGTSFVSGGEAGYSKSLVGLSLDAKV